MAYNYLGLVNDVNGRVNETPLIASNFISAVGFYSTVKESVNSAIRELNQQAYHWPHNHTTFDETLTAGTSRYAFQADSKIIDWGTFRIRESSTLGNETKLLKNIDYDEYLHKYIDSEYSTTTTDREVPEYVSRTPSLSYVVYPNPDKAYTLTYEYHKLPVDLIADSDVPSLPEAFRHIIVDGAMVNVYNFRGDTETRDRASARFMNGIENMRKIYINNGYLYMRDTRVHHRSTFNTHVGSA